MADKINMKNEINTENSNRVYDSVGNDPVNNDPVNNPAHYTDGKIECIDYIKDKLTPEEFKGFCKGNALKYISRAGKKNANAEAIDIQKCIWYLKKYLKELGCKDE